MKLSIFLHRVHELRVSTLEPAHTVVVLPHCTALVAAAGLHPLDLAIALVPLSPKGRPPLAHRRQLVALLVGVQAAAS